MQPSFRFVGVAGLAIGREFPIGTVPTQSVETLKTQSPFLLTPW